VTTYVITEKQRDQRIFNFHRLIARGFYISAENDGHGLLYSSNDRREISKAFTAHPNADAFIDCERFGKDGNKKLVLLTIDGQSDHRRYSTFERLDKAGLNPGGAFDHKEGLLFSVSRADQRPDIELAPGIWLLTNVEPLPADFVGVSDFVSPLPAVLEDRARKATLREWTEQSSANGKALWTFVRNLNPSGRAMALLHGISIQGGEIRKNWTDEEALLFDIFNAVGA
jgi:hypothetical protein